MVVVACVSGCNNTESSRTLKDDDGMPVVETSTARDVTGSTALCGGVVTADAGGNVEERGVCWDTQSNPCVRDNHVIAGSGLGTFNCEIKGLLPDTKYYVRAYAISSMGISYGAQMSFITDKHAYVDLDLPSGTLWATCNVGANKPEDFGEFYAWGDTMFRYIAYEWRTYFYCNSDDGKLTKYCYDGAYGSDGYTDDLTILEPIDDVATAKWGCDWSTPSIAQWQELFDNTTNTRTSLNGVCGRRFTAKNGEEIFLPAAGGVISHPAEGGVIISEIGDECVTASYWSSSLSTEYHPSYANFMFFDSKECYVGASNTMCPRCEGLSIRPVRSAK